MAHGPAPSPDHDAAHNCGKGSEGCFGVRCIEWKTKSNNGADRWVHGTMPCGERQWRSKLTAEDVLEIRRLRGKETQAALAVRFGISRPHVSGLQCGHAWSWLSEESSR
jgi:hypothetical protein